MRFGIIKERKNPPDRRVVFTPEELVRLQNEHPEAIVKEKKTETKAISPASPKADVKKKR